MSLFSAFGKAGLNFVSKLGEIVAPLDEDDEENEDNRKTAREANIDGADSEVKHNDGQQGEGMSLLNHFTAITSANLSGIFNELVNEKVASDVPPKSNDSKNYSNNALRELAVRSSSEPSSSCMVEIELDESFESTSYQSPSFEEVQLVQSNVFVEEEVEDKVEDVFLGEQEQLSSDSPDPIYSLLIPDPSNKTSNGASHDPSTSSSIKSPMELSDNLVNGNHESSGNGYDNAISSPVSLSPIPFSPIVNDFASYKPVSISSAPFNPISSDSSASKSLTVSQPVDSNKESVSSPSTDQNDSRHIDEPDREENLLNEKEDSHYNRSVVSALSQSHTPGTLNGSSNIMSNVSNLNIEKDKEDDGVLKHKESEYSQEMHQNNSLVADLQNQMRDLEEQLGNCCVYCDHIYRSISVGNYLSTQCCLISFVEFCNLCSSSDVADCIYNSKNAILQRNLFIVPFSLSFLL
jgi:hypothetical protein